MTTRELNDDDLKWLVLRWRDAEEENAADVWREISLLMHGAWMAVYRHSPDDAEIYDALGDLADARRDEARANEHRRAA